MCAINSPAIYVLLQIYWIYVSSYGLVLLLRYSCNHAFLEHAFRPPPRQLLVTLPTLHSDLYNYPITITNIREWAIPSLAPFFLDHFNKDLSPYEVNVCEKLTEYLGQFSEDLIDVYLQQVCPSLSIILKNTVTNMALVIILIAIFKAMLDDSDATNTKPLEN